NFFQSQNAEQMKQINRTMEKKMSDLQQNNEKKLDEMRATVDEKLQKTLENRLTESFKQVSERLERVYKSLGEMQKVSAGVDDLKRVLSNVKTRGILGEVQLGSILEQILSPEQYDTNVITKKGSTERVEYAVKMPGTDNGFVYLPIDAKFPLDAYQKLLDAYDSRNRDFVKDAQKELKTRIKGFAKDISTKYIDVPNTTEFAIMFLPTEGLYSEVVRMGLIEELQREKINIAGPTTMAALLNSLQMGFKTLAVQKKSAEVWKVLAEVKTEFAKFSDSLEKTKRIMSKAQDELNILSGTRMNVMNRKLKDVSTFDYTSDNRVQIAGGEENE
ncbi:MAG: DNA recombination protein RmuC, partial [Oscillospiraceae bacterium]|nr:DNA recombination protein RmuC [Oscillospiraceae bacterium]